MRPTLLLSLVLILTPTLIQAQAPARSSATATCTARIRPLAAADYDPSSEVVLAGTVVEIQGSTLRLRLACGTVRVELGSSLSAATLTLGQAVTITGCKRQNESGQRFLAREVRTGSQVLVLRDADGVPAGA